MTKNDDGWEVYMPPDLRRRGGPGWSR